VRKKTDTWMPIYIGDYLADTGHLTTTQHGAYLLLLMHYWRKRELPVDDKQLAAIAKLPLRIWLDTKETIQAFFHDGWKHKRIEEEIQRRLEVSEKRAAAGSEGGKSRGKKEANASVLLEQNPSMIQSQKQKDSEAKASGADAPDPRTRLFSEGLAKIAELTGKGPDSCRTFVGKCLKESSDDASVVLGIIDDAYRNRVADAGAWIMARVKGAKQIGGVPSVDWDAVLSAYKKTGHWSRYAGNDPSSPGCRCPPEILAKYGLLQQSETVQ
jgi:uncharacterized protein YdaU (DUF1376 family)